MTITAPVSEFNIKKVKNKSIDEPHSSTTEKKDKIKLAIDKDSLKKYKLIAVAYSHVEREWFPTQEAYEAEAEVIDRANQVIQEIKKLRIPVKGYPADQYFLSHIMVDKPDLVLNLVDTYKGRDALQTTVPATLEMCDIPYTGAGMKGMVLGNDRNLFKQLLQTNGIPTAPFQYIRTQNTKIDTNLGLPLIIKLNESGGSVGIDNNAVKESYEDAQKQVEEMIKTYKMPVLVEKFIDGSEITACVFDDGKKHQVFLAQKDFKKPQDGKHYFTSYESYDEKDPYTYKSVDPKLERKIIPMVIKAFRLLKHKDYAKYDIRIVDVTGDIFFTDANPNTAFGPDIRLPLTQVLDMYGVTFEEMLCSMLTKHAKRLVNG